MLGSDGSANSEKVYINGISPKNLSREIRKGPGGREAHDGILIKVPGSSAVLLVTVPLICPEKI
jgi:hypothetical protein